MISKSDMVRKIILDKINSGVYAEGDLIPSDNVLPGELGISRSITREAIASLVREGYLYRVQGKGTYVAEKSNASEQRNGSAGDIVLMSRDVLGFEKENYSLGELIRGMHSSNGLSPHPLRVVTFSEDDMPCQILRDAAQKSSVFGVVFFGFDVDADMKSLIRSLNIKAVSIGKPLSGAEIPYVDSDNKKGAYDAIRYLIGLGHKDIAIIDHNAPHQPSYDARCEGYKAAFCEYGLKLKKELFYTGSAPNSESGEKGAKYLLSGAADFSALLVYGDYPLIACMGVLREAGRKIPSNLSVVMYSGFDWVSAALGIEITRVRQSQFKLGKRAIDVLTSLEASESPGAHVVDVSLEFGKSCRQLEN